MVWSPVLPSSPWLGVRSIPGAAVVSLSAAPRAVVQDIALSLGSGWDTACKEASLVFIAVEKRRKGFWRPRPSVVGCWNSGVRGGSVWEVSLSLSSKKLLWCPTTVQLSLLAAKAEAEMQRSRNPRLVWVGRVFKGHLIPLPAMGRDTFRAPAWIGMH